MKKIKLLICSLFLLAAHLHATNYDIEAGNYYYFPQSLTVNIGDSVTWTNVQGVHNVNFVDNTITGNSFNNPVSFISSPTASSFLYTHVFNVAGTYEYDCSVGSHAVDGMVGTIIVNGQNVNIPDANFKAYLVGISVININGDTEIQVSEATAFNGGLICGGGGISDLTGIEAFTALTSLWCQGNQLTSLDVSQNLALTNLACSANQLTSLDVSQNLALTSLHCSSNQLTSLDVSQNLALTSSLNCSSNQLTSLDVRNGNNTNLNYFYATNNSNLTCINVDDAVYSSATWTVANGNIDSTMSFSTNCATVFGCTDPNAYNYDSLATINDSSCVYCDLNIDSLGVTQMTCYSWNNASVNIIATGTQPLPYNYYVVRLNPTDTVLQGNIGFTNGLASGVYVAVVEDSLGCLDSDTFTINSLNSVYIDSVIYSNVSCNGIANGYISAIIPMGGTPPYQFSLNGGQLYSSFLCAVSPSCPTGYVFTALAPGSHNVEIWDSNMCANSYQIFITEPNPLFVNAFSTDISCFGYCDGSAFSMPSGGTLPYSYLWSNGNITDNISGLCAGAYVVNITDANNCVNIETVVISEPPPLVLNNTINGCDSVLIGSNYYTISGAYTDTLTSVNGCDSVVNTNLTIGQNTSSYDTLSVGASIVWNGMPLNVSGDYSVTLVNSVGCDSIVNLNLTVTTTGISDIANNKSNLVKITDMLGQETPYRRNTPLFYIYDDGTVEKRIVIE